MGQVAYQLLVGLRLVQQTLFALLARLLLNRQQLHHQFIGVACLRHDHMHGQHVAVVSLQPCVKPQRAHFVVDHAFKGIEQHRRVSQEIGQVFTHEQALGGTQGVFQLGVGKNDVPVKAHHRHQRCQQVKGKKTGVGHCSARVRTRRHRQAP